jgi:hypothetical protein
MVVQSTHRINFGQNGTESEVQKKGPKYQVLSHDPAHGGPISYFRLLQLRAPASGLWSKEMQWRGP